MNGCATYLKNYDLLCCIQQVNEKDSGMCRKQTCKESTPTFALIREQTKIWMK